MAEIKCLRGEDAFGQAPCLTDIPLMLERTAARIRAGECGEVLRVAMVLRAADRPCDVLAFGSSDSCQSFEDLHLGASALLRMLEG